MVYNYDELYHHGILGMKWGKRNGPPYPLDGADHSASEKKAGWRKSLDSGSNLAFRKKKKNDGQSGNSGSGTHIYREEENNKAKHEEKKRSVSYESGGNRKKTVGEMDDKELKREIDRMRLENDYARLAGNGVKKYSNTGETVGKVRGIKGQINKLGPSDENYKWEKYKNNPDLSKEANKAAKKEHNALQKEAQDAFNAKKHDSKVTNKAVDTGLSVVDSASKLSRMNNDRKVEKAQNQAREQAKQMEYKDLKATVDRLNMEQQYNQLVNAQQTKKGAEYALQALEVTGAVLAVAVPAYQLYKEVKKSNKGSD